MTTHKTLYTANATVQRGREGNGKTDDGTLDLTLSPPGGGKPGTNPEQLFAIGYAACFGGAVAAVARKKSLATGDVSIESHVSLRQGDDGYSIAVELDVNLPSLDEDAAIALVNEAHQVCPYSKATRGNIEVVLKANGALAH